MNFKVNNFSDDASIIKAIADNHKEFSECYAKTANGNFCHDSSVLQVKSGIPLRVFNGIFYNNFPEAETKNKIEKIKKDFLADGLPFVWWITPCSQPRNLGDSIEKNGFKLIAQIPGMAIDMDKLNDNIPVLQELTIRKVTDYKGLALWTEVLLQSFGIPLTSRDDCLELFNNLLQDKSCLYYLGFINGSPISVSLLFCGTATAGIYWVGTLPEARKKGVGAAITLKALLDAREIGYPLAILRASVLGYPVYKKLGFIEYCKMGLYVTI